MGKNKKRTNLLDESCLILNASPTEATITAPTVDTHTHLLSTFKAYHEKYPEGAHATVYDFARAVTAGRNVEAMVDVYCEAPIQKAWKELADSALTEESRKEKWGGMEYWFVMGAY
jgi:TatD DNase family protein